jgi:hypothetical protein
MRTKSFAACQGQPSRMRESSQMGTKFIATALTNTLALLQREVRSHFHSLSQSRAWLLR